MTSIRRHFIFPLTPLAVIDLDCKLFVINAPVPFPLLSPINSVIYYSTVPIVNAYKLFVHFALIIISNLLTL